MQKDKSGATTLHDVETTKAGWSLHEKFVNAATSLLALFNRRSQQIAPSLMWAAAPTSRWLTPPTRLEATVSGYFKALRQHFIMSEEVQQLPITLLEPHVTGITLRLFGDSVQVALRGTSLAFVNAVEARTSAMTHTFQLSISEEGQTATFRSCGDVLLFEIPLGESANSICLEKVTLRVAFASSDVVAVFGPSTPEIIVTTEVTEVSPQMAQLSKLSTQEVLHSAFLFSSLFAPHVEDRAALEHLLSVEHFAVKIDLLASTVEAMLEFHQGAFGRVCDSAVGDGKSGEQREMQVRTRKSVCLRVATFCY